MIDKQTLTSEPIEIHVKGKETIISNLKYFCVKNIFPFSSLNICDDYQ